MNNQLFYFVDTVQSPIYNQPSIVNMPVVMNTIAPITFLLDNTFNVPRPLLSFDNQATIPYNTNNGFIIASTVPNNTFNYMPMPSIKVEGVQESLCNVSSSYSVKVENSQGSSCDVPASEPIKIENLPEPDVQPLAICKTEIAEANPSDSAVVDITFDDVLSEDENICDHLDIKCEIQEEYGSDAISGSCVSNSSDQTSPRENPSATPITESKTEICNSKEAFLNYITNGSDLPEQNITNNGISEAADEDGVLYINGTVFSDIDVLNDNSLRRKEPFSRKKLWKPGQSSVSAPADPVKPQLTLEEVKKLVSLKCNECDFSTQKGVLDLKRHKLIHKGVKIYKCDVCSYQTSTRSYLRVHMLVHFKNKQVKMHKCVKCAYETRDYSNLLKHRRVHLTSEELDKLPYHHCSYCNYRTKFKDICLKHERIHKKPGEIRMYQCDKCPFYSRYGLHKHKLVHKEITELDFLQCGSCSYLTLCKRALNEHMIKHKSPDELEWFYCNECDFKSPLKRKLKCHIMVRHLAPANKKSKSFKCHICTYASNNKNNLKSHLLRHQDPADCQLFACATCDYTTRLKEDLRLHVKRHLKQREKEIET
ncbi:zinc finger autosomal protein-like [Cylas formicarius]|uniref:zinc finger autosomal protein-like n=1 Tax=Cylas formicarius TaxID=197179 RepID=UPI0029589188|nr:zinc finger autosomal protein-like [Cylas formicarius]XP_060534989.1 zinc finger autosomal protein-like [Cylas formicarius]